MDYRILFLCLITSCLSHNLFAQRQYLGEPNTWYPGYSVTLQGDTLFGEIQSGTFYRNQEQVRMRLEPGEERNFNPDGMLAYGFNIGPANMVYQRCQVEGQDSPFENRMYFLRQLQSGKMAVYEFHYYTQRYSHRWYKKRYVISLVPGYALGQNWSGKRLKIEAKPFFKDCEALIKALEDGRFRQNEDLLEMGMEYNQCDAIRPYSSLKGD